MKKFKKYLTYLLVILVMGCGLLVSSCFAPKSIVNIAKSGQDGLTDIYTIYYSDGTTQNFTVTNGKDGAKGDKGENGKDGIDGEDGQDGVVSKEVTIEDIYNLYVSEYGDISYSEFLERYLNISYNDNSEVIGKCLLSSMQIYSEVTVTENNVKSIGFSCGSAVVYRIDSDYSYIVTNYHVVYSEDANEDSPSGIAYRIFGYVYGSEGYPSSSGLTDSNGYAIYNYGDTGLELEYIGGSVIYDIAVLRVETADLLDINEDIEAVTLAKDYYVGETAIAIGNPENYGISASEGIVSVEDEYITLAIDGVRRNYRSIRMDTAIYSGSSGGGLFNKYGELIGITNAGNTEDQNINYAIPIQIVKGAVNNILDNYDDTNMATVKKPTLGVNVEALNSKYVYDKDLGYGKIKDDVRVTSVTSNSIFDKMGISEGDYITAIYIGLDKYEVTRYFDIGDIVLNMRVGDIIKVAYTRDGEASLSTAYSIKKSDI